MLSISETYKEKTIGILLSGMGKDGSIGMKSIQNEGGLTIVQDQKSSLIYGMPQSAIESGAASYILPIQQISDFLIRTL